jgi:hypothetical protein
MRSRSKRQPVERRTHRGATRPRRRPARQKALLEVIEQLLARRVSIDLNGKPTRVPAIKAIVFQLLQQDMKGDARASRTLLKYLEFARAKGKKSAELAFVESEYTKAFANSRSGGVDG